MKPQYAIIYDLETSGLEQNRHDITQIAATVIELRSLERGPEFEAKIDFDRHSADPEALKINSYDESVWTEQQIPKSQAAALFDRFIQPYRYSFISQKGNLCKTGFGCGHNTERFDAPFLQAWYRRMGKWCPIGFKGMDTLQMALTLETCRHEIDFGGKHKLADVAGTLGIPIPENLHDAMDDVRLTADVFVTIMRMLRGEA